MRVVFTKSFMVGLGFFHSQYLVCYIEAKAKLYIIHK